MGRRYLKSDEYILVDQKIRGTNKLDKDELKSLYDYTPNDRILIFPWSPYVGLYHIGEKNYDSMRYVRRIDRLNLKFKEKIAAKEENEKKQKKLSERLGKKVTKTTKNLREGNFAMRLGEPLAVYDTVKETQTVQNLTSYLHSKGYFNAEVSFGSEQTFKLVTTTYTITKNEPYVIDSIVYDVKDSVMSRKLIKDSLNSLIQKGELYEQTNLTKERDRINSLMQNNGYYDFNRRYVGFVADTTSLGDRKVIVLIKIQNPEDKDAHKVYKIDSIVFVTDANINGRSLPRNTTQYKGVSYKYHDKKYSEKILDWRVFINQDSVYQRDNTFETQKQLSNMDIFKFININYDTTGGKFVANVFTTPLKKYQTSSEMGLNVSNGLPGPFFNASIKNRNTFKGLEIMELSGRIGFEGLSGVSEQANPYSSFDYGGNLAFTFPQFMFPLGSKLKSELGRFNPKTRLSFGLNFNYRLEYQRNTINTSLLYTWLSHKNNVRHSFNLADVSYIKSSITDDDFQEFLDTLKERGNNLFNSFNSAFVNSIWYSATYNINNYGNKEEPSAYLRYRVETGGNSASLYEELGIQDAIDFYKFAKFRIDYRRTVPYSSRAALAYRINMGYAIPYGSNETLPYEKFYFAGGSNSIRAWEPRRLGPGAYLPIQSGSNYNNDLEQPGEILLEGSVELRHELFEFIQGAIFVDVGNTWTLRYDADRPGSQFKFDSFYRQIAVGAGYGIRFDLSFLILRLDAAWKVYEPGNIYEIGEGDFKRTVVDSRNTFELPDFKGYQRLVWNLGIGYPF